MCEIQSQNGDIHVCGKKGQENWIFFFQQKRTGKRTHSCSMCSDFWPPFDPPSISASGAIYFVMLFSTEIPQMWKKAEQIYEWTLYICVDAGHTVKYEM